MYGGQGADSSIVDLRVGDGVIGGHRNWAPFSVYIERAAKGELLIASKVRAKLVLQLYAECLSGRTVASLRGAVSSITAVLDVADAGCICWDEAA